MGHQLWSGLSEPYGHNGPLGLLAHMTQRYQQACVGGLDSTPVIAGVSRSVCISLIETLASRQTRDLWQIRCDE